MPILLCEKLAVAKIPETNPVRDILSQAAKKDLISFGGGYPAADTLPVEIYPILTQRAIEEFGSVILQYSPTEATDFFRKVELAYLKQLGLRNLTEDWINVSHGSQQALDLLVRMLIKPGDKIVVTAPTYLGALQAWNLLSPQYLIVESDEDGVIPDSLKKIFDKNPDIKFTYIGGSNFANPTGITLSPIRRYLIGNLLLEQGQLLIEDDPYGELDYDGLLNGNLPLQAYAPANVIHLRTFSKIFSPEKRLGVVVAHPEIQNYFIRLKQGADLCTSGLDQAMAAIFIRDGHLAAHLKKIMPVYKRRMETLHQALDYFMPEEIVFRHAKRWFV